MDPWLKAEDDEVEGLPANLRRWRLAEYALSLVCSLRVASPRIAGRLSDFD